MNWPAEERYSSPLQSLVVSLFLSLVFTILFSQTGRCTVLSKFFNTQAPSISTKKLVLFHHASCVLSHLFCNEHSLLLSSYLSRMGRIENPSCSTCRHLSQDASSHFAVSSYGLFALFALWRLSVSLRPLVQGLESCPASGASWSYAMPPSLGRGWVTTATT